MHGPYYWAMAKDDPIQQGEVQTLVLDVTATGVDGRDAIIRDVCQPGLEVQLRAAAGAVEVLVQVPKFFGIVRSWKVVGLLKADPEHRILSRVKSGKVLSAKVLKSYAPKGKSHPMLKIEIEVLRAAESRLAPLN